MADDARRGRRNFSKGPARSRHFFREGREGEMPTGTIKKLVSDRGFGFIAAEDGREYFFHRTGLDSSVNFDSLAGGGRVSFEIEASPKGPRAERIKLALISAGHRAGPLRGGPFFFGGPHRSKTL